MTVKLYADNLRKREGVDLNRLSALMQQDIKAHSKDGTVASALLYQTLSNTNTWRESGYERGAPGENTVFAVDRIDAH